MAAPFYDPVTQMYSDGMGGQYFGAQYAHLAPPLQQPQATPVAPPPAPPPAAPATSGQGMNETVATVVPPQQVQQPYMRQRYGAWQGEPQPGQQVQQPYRSPYGGYMGQGGQQQAGEYGRRRYGQHQGGYQPQQPAAQPQPEQRQETGGDRTAPTQTMQTVAPNPMQPSNKPKAGGPTNVSRF